MSHSTEKSPCASPRARAKGLKAFSLPADFWFKERDLKHALAKMHLKKSVSSGSTPADSPRASSKQPNLQFFQSFKVDPPGPDHFSQLSDELLLQIFSKLPISQHVSNSLVCKRWLYLHGRLVQSLNVTDWSFIESGRVFLRFPNLSDINIIRACFRTSKNSGILVTHKALSVHVDTRVSSTNGFVGQIENLLPSDLVDQGLELLAEKYPNLRRVVVIGASENGLLSIADECYTLQELELHCCGDLSLKGISVCQNLQVVKLIGSIDGFYGSVVSDIGLTILAQGCRRLVKLELTGCEGSYDGIKAIGQCCQMLEELTLCDHRMDGGWLSALTFCGNLKTLRLQLCKGIDSSPGLPQHLGSCLTLEELQLQGCQLRDKQSVEALFLVCENVREIVVQNCWGLEDDVFGLASICRYYDFFNVHQDINTAICCFCAYIF